MNSYEHVDVFAPMRNAIESNAVRVRTDEGGAAVVEHDVAAAVAARDLEEANEARQIELSGAISLNSYELTRRLAAVEQHTDKIANYVQGLPTRDDTDALLRDAVMTQREIKALTLAIAALADSVQMLMKAKAA